MVTTKRRCYFFLLKNTYLLLLNLFLDYRRTSIIFIINYIHKQHGQVFTILYITIFSLEFSANFSDALKTYFNKKKLFAKELEIFVQLNSDQLKNL